MRDESGHVYAALGMIQDITLQRRLETDLRQRNAELAESEAAKSALIDKLRYSIQELSTPILEVWDDVLVMPVIGVVDSRRTADMVQRLLAEVARSQASYVIVDLTGVEVVDTKTADHLLKLIRKVEVVGSRCVLTGIRSAVAETLWRSAWISGGSPRSATSSTASGMPCALRGSSAKEPSRIAARIHRTTTMTMRRRAARVERRSRT